MTGIEAVNKVVTQFTYYNQTLVNCVNKGAMSKDIFREEVFDWMSENIPEAYRNQCYEELVNAAWSYDILVPMINDDGTISDISCHSWNNVWKMVRGKWEISDIQFRGPDHYNQFFSRISRMNSRSISERNATDNCTDITTFDNYRLRLNFVHRSLNTNGSDIFSIRKIPTHKKTLEVLCRPEEGMLTLEMLPIIRKHLKEATGVLLVGMGGSGKTTLLNALIEELPLDWKFLFIQENEELFSDTHINSDFLRTVKGINQYDISHDMKELTRNGLLMSIRCFVIGETKGDEALYLFNAMNTGAFGMTTAHSDSSVHGLDKLADYIKYASDYTKDQCMEMLTSMNKVFFLDHYRLKEITTIHGYDSDKHKLICDTEYYNQ